jgi:hypothetical protein
MIPKEYQNLEVKKQDSKFWWFICPFHNDHNPSMTVNKSGQYTGHFKCWACGKIGSAKHFAYLMGNQTIREWPKPKYSEKHYRQKFKPDMALQAMGYCENMNLQKYQIAKDLLKIEIPILKALSIGWDNRAFTFPMYDEDSHIIGIRRRFANNSKGCLMGSSLGLFVPEFNYAQEFDLLITEGESDCMAALSYGFQAIGRPNCNSCVGLIIKWLNNKGFNSIVIVADNDAAGILGAKKLAEETAFAGITTKIITPPEEFKDLREWYLSGASKGDILDMIINVDYVSPVKIKYHTQKLVIEIGIKHAAR